ncbi:dihydroorotase [Pseudidiomarina terrestris]|uniref:Dihydroorotase n=1 Tax=Pseudidiomarina terrestris TaxID=2820060 RepID=A0ABT8MHM1_9GAMM|nr:MULTISPECIES: dihydroorotase [unclassified Pseudidiomarina]MDN7129447.1 dihydroorotase [Pseudidiomarina sp. 1APR75-15]MDN7134288.1 dihydroorotase [Pseudidiomarina sp. 1ASP75-5]MDN7137024.1 dihydroorotase [Pseudidiomarina sp. 1ASP75-14]
MQQLSLPRPDDWHLHLRDNELLATTVPASASVFGRAVIMPNLVPPVTDAQQAMAYRERIMAEVPAGADFQPLMALYLTQQTSRVQVEEAAADENIIGFKLYPSGATTNSAAGVTDIEALDHVFAAMAELKVPLLVHGEVTTADIDIFDREKVFIDTKLRPLMERHPQLKLILEHITTSDAVAFVESMGANVAATITPQHLLMNRNDLLVGGVRPHNYCLPILKRREHQLALQKAAVSGSPKFFLGTDSAPHAQSKKEAACGCAGCYSAPAALELYAEFFERMDALDKLADFASHFGADFYGYPRATETVTLRREPWQVAATIDTAVGPMVPYWANETLNWQVEK